MNADAWKEYQAAIKEGQLEDQHIVRGRSAWEAILMEDITDSELTALTDLEIGNIEIESTKIVKVVEIFGATGDKDWTKALDAYIKEISTTISRVVQNRLSKGKDKDSPTWKAIDQNLQRKLGWIFYKGHPKTVTGTVCLPIATPGILQSCMVSFENISNAMKEVSFLFTYLHPIL